MIGDAEHFWQKRYYDHNVRSYAKFVEQLRYIHRNPVKRGLCERPEDWQWSSFLHYATGIERPTKLGKHLNGATLAVLSSRHELFFPDPGQNSVVANAGPWPKGVLTPRTKVRFKTCTNRLQVSYICHINDGLGARPFPVCTYM